MIDLTVQVKKILDDFSKTWSFDSRDLARPTADAVLRQLIQANHSELHQRLEGEFFALGPLSDIIQDPEIQEIVVNGPEEIWYEKNSELHRLNDRFFSLQTFNNFIERLCSVAQIKVDLARPFADGRWLDFRVHLGCAPLTHCQFHLTLRRLPQNPWTIEQLVKAGWTTISRAQVLIDLMNQRKNILFLGPTGCGKTTVLGACLKLLSENERVVILEDTEELPRPNSASTKLLTRSLATANLPEVTLSDLVRQSLRMRPFRIVLGEVRGAEAKDLLLALATGHSGSLGTIHALDARQALLRLEMLIQLGAPQWNHQAVRQLIHMSVDALVVCGYDNGQRRLIGIYKIAALESFGFLLEPLI